MRGLSLICGLVLLLLSLVVAHADEQEALECSCLCAPSCWGGECEVLACDVVFVGDNCTPETTQHCSDDCCTGFEPGPPPVE